MKSSHCKLSHMRDKLADRYNPGNDCLSYHYPWLLNQCMGNGMDMMFKGNTFSMCVCDSA